MSPRYIDANELKATLYDRRNSALKLGGLDDQIIAGAVSGVIRLIDAFPTVEVAEIARCRDCLYFVTKVGKGGCRNTYCRMLKNHFTKTNLQVHKEDYCSFGVDKREGVVHDRNDSRM